MDTATDNARELLKNLQLEYNRARQTAITQEITRSWPVPRAAGMTGTTRTTTGPTPSNRPPHSTRKERLLCNTKV